jgi:hypothetical protein
MDVRCTWRLPSCLKPATQFFRVQHMAYLPVGRLVIRESFKYTYFARCDEHTGQDGSLFVREDLTQDEWIVGQIMDC